MSKEYKFNEKIIHALSEMSIKFDELGFTPTTLNDENYEYFVDWFKDEVKTIREEGSKQEKQISDLEAKLAESEKDRLMWQEMYKSADRQNKNICETDIYPLQEENENYQKLINDICNKHKVVNLKELDEIIKATNESLDASRKYLDEETSKRWALEKQVDHLKQQLAELECKLNEKQKSDSGRGWRLENGKIIYFCNLLSDYKCERSLEDVVKDLNQMTKESDNAWEMRTLYQGLKQQLAEKEKEIERLQGYISCSGCVSIIAKAKTEANQTAIAELEKAKIEFETYYADNIWNYSEYLQDRIKELTHQNKTKIKEKSRMTFNELKKEYAGFILRTSKEEWEIVKKTKGKCKVEYNADCYDREVYFDVI